MSKNKPPKKVSQQQKSKAAEKLLNKIDAALKEYGQVNDPAVQEAVKHLRDVKSNLEGNKQNGNKEVPRDWVALSKYLLLAAQWLKFLYSFFLE